MRLKENREGIAVANDASVTRYNYTLQATYELIDAKKGTVLIKSTQSTLSAYNVVTSPYGTLTAQQDAQKRAADDIAQRLRIDLGIYFARRARGGQ